MAETALPGKVVRACLVSLICLAPLLANADTSSFSFLGEGEAKLSFRYRYEFVDQTGYPEDAQASTLRSRLTYQTPSDQKIALVLEADNVLRVGGDRYSDGNRTVPGRPVVADPIGTEFNQAYVSLQPDSRLSFSLGRQRINLDDQRFIGGVGWRQNEQTYDAGRIRLSLPAGPTLDYSYLWNINRVFGPEGGAQASDWNCNCHALNLGMTPWENARIALFVYHLDLDEAVSVSNRALGARISGTFNFPNGADLNYLVSYARQSDVGQNPVDYSADYYHVRLGVKTKLLSASFGYEILGSDSGRAGAAFVTPLATLHGFNGWADKFLATPDAGLVDLYGQLAFDVEGFVTSIVYHRYAADYGGADFGSEWNLSFSRKVSKQLGLLGKLAAYDSDGFATDTEKVWLMVSYSP